MTAKKKAKKPLGRKTLKRTRGGATLRPAASDEVIVSFEQGDMRRPYVLGSLWNGKDKPPG